MGYRGETQLGAHKISKKKKTKQMVKYILNASVFVFAVLYLMDQVFYNQSKGLEISVLCLCVWEMENACVYLCLCLLWSNIFLWT